METSAKTAANVEEVFRKKKRFFKKN